MIDVSKLTAFVDEQRLPLIRKSVFAAPSTKYFNLQTGVKHSAALNILNTNVVLGDGSTCGWNPAGTSEFSQRILEVAPIKVNMNFCDKDLLKYWMGYEVRVAAGQKELPFEEEFVNGVIEGIRAKLENILWNGDTTLKVDGILKTIATDGTQTTLSGASLYDKLIEVYQAIPANIIKDAVIFVGEDVFRTLIVEMTAKNLYHYNPQYDERLTFVLPGTSTKVVAVEGLNGVKAMVAANPENIYYGVDMEGDSEKFDLWYSKDAQEFRLAINFNAGVQVAFPDEVVYGSWS